MLGGVRCPSLRFRSTFLLDANPAIFFPQLFSLRLERLGARPFLDRFRRVHLADNDLALPRYPFTRDSHVLGSLNVLAQFHPSPLKRVAGFGNIRIQLAPLTQKSRIFGHSRTGKRFIRIANAVMLTKRFTIAMVGIPDFTTLADTSIQLLSLPSFRFLLTRPRCIGSHGFLVLV